VTDATQLLEVAAGLRAQASALEAFAARLEAGGPPAPPRPSAPTPADWIAKDGAGLQTLAPFTTALAASRVVFGGKLLDDQRAGCLRLCVAGAGFLPLGWMAYVLATGYHETGHLMVPVHEKGGDAYLSKYDTGRLAEALGNTPQADGDGIKWAGRGDVQLTGARLYQRADAKLAALKLIKPGDLLADPDLALRPDLSAEIIVQGMREGWFTGKKLNDYVRSKGDLTQFTNARRIVNGTDRAADIAAYAVAFQDALTAGGWL
jgi:hypothetical protein